jgi:hypothetical protein
VRGTTPPNGPLSTPGIRGFNLLFRARCIIFVVIGVTGGVGVSLGA